MGVDLTLLVVDGPSVPYSHTMLEFGRYYEVFDQLKKVAMPMLPERPLSCFRSRVPDGSYEGECCYGQLTETPYGEKLTYVTAQQFLLAVTEAGGQNLIGKDQFARACLGYVVSLKPDTLIGLYYH